jgi:pimeloyl-ACP methyl ester carboxylesterase
LTTTTTTTGPDVRDRGIRDRGIRDLDVRGRRVHIHSAGSGRPLLYLHGMGDMGTWTPALSGLAETFTVLRPDHPGFNDSDDDPAVDTMLDLAFSYLDVLDALSLERVDLVGMSLGGWLAAELAVLAPHRIGRVVLLAPAGLRVETPAPDVFTLDPAELAALTVHDPAAKAAAVAGAEQIGTDNAVFQRYLRNRAASAHLGWNPYMHDAKFRDRVHRLAAPTLVLWGEQDEIIPVAQATTWADAVPHAVVETVPAAGHLVLADQPDVVVDRIKTFLSEGGAA